YIIYADESIYNGPRYSNFYGGALVRGRDINRVIVEIKRVKSSLKLSEVKWHKVSESYLDKYEAFVDHVFDFVRTDTLTFRIMFTDNRIKPTKLTEEHRRNRYFILYYQFLKHAFGLQ